MNLVPRTKRAIVVFDLDYTVCRNDTFLTFLKATLRQRPVRFLRALWLPVAFLIRSLGLRDSQWLKERFLSAIAAGLGPDDVASLRHSVNAQILQKDVRASARQAIERHKSNGDYLVLATASFDFYCEEIGNQLGFDACVCTRAEFDEAGILTGRIVGRNCKGQEKLRRVLELVSGKSLSGAAVYTDHHSDLPLLRWAERRFLVRPTAKLLREINGLEHTVYDW